MGELFLGFDANGRKIYVTPEDRANHMHVIGSPGFGEMQADGYGEADIPVIIPVPFEELSSIQYWSLEEQIWRMSDALKEQFPRHCFIKVLNQKTQPMLVPLIKEFYVSTEDLAQFQNDLYRSMGAIPGGEADQILNKQKEDLKLLAKEDIQYPTRFRE
jgi:hypothetical protein